MKNILIVFSGKAQSGKSTSANTLKQIIEKQYSDISVEIYSFATAIKEMARTYFGWDGNKELFFPTIDHKTGEDVEVFYKDQEPIRDKGRALLINIGQQMRWIRPTIWVDYVMKQINLRNAVKKENIVFVIDDMRFANEDVIAKKFPNCYSVRMSRNSQLDLKDISEVDLDKGVFDFYIENNGAVDELKYKLEEIWLKIVTKTN